MNKITIKELTPMEVRWVSGDVIFFSICEFADKVFGKYLYHNHWDNTEYSYNA